MNRGERRRHEQRKAARQVAAANRCAVIPEPELTRTRGVIYELGTVQVRNLQIDATEPMPAIVRFGRGMMLAHATGEIVRTVSVHNWNDDKRELFDIPEARAFMRRLWAEAKPLLRMLTESTAAPTPDDVGALGDMGPALTLMGMGWLDIYTLGHHFTTAEDVKTIPDGWFGKWFQKHPPALLRAAHGMTDERRRELRAELLEITDDNPGGSGFDAAAERTYLAENHAQRFAQLATECMAEGKLDSVFIVASMLDDIGRQVATAAVGNDATMAHLARCRDANLHPAAVVAVPREFAVANLSFAPQTAAMLQTRLPAGEFWTLTIAAGGTQTGRVQAAGVPR